VLRVKGLRSPEFWRESEVGKGPGMGSPRRRLPPVRSPLLPSSGTGSEQPRLPEGDTGEVGRKDPRWGCARPGSGLLPISTV